MTSTLRPIKTCAWNVGGGWLAGAEANLPHVLDALSHGGPMANIDILILTEAKLQDFTTVRSISQRLHFAASHNHSPIRCTESDKTCAARCSFFALCTHSTRFTPWGGVIIAVLNPSSQQHTSHRARRACSKFASAGRKMPTARTASAPCLTHSTSSQRTTPA